MEDGTNESDEELPFGPIAELKFYDGDERLPVYKWGLSKRMNTDEAAQILLKERSDHTGVATRVPTNISKHSVFVVDTSTLSNKADVKYDELGACLCTGSNNFLYSKDDNGVCHKMEDEGDCPSDYVLYIAQRPFFSTKACPLRESRL